MTSSDRPGQAGLDTDVGGQVSGHEDGAGPGQAGELGGQLRGLCGLGVGAAEQLGHVPVRVGGDELLDREGPAGGGHHGAVEVQQGAHSGQTVGPVQRRHDDGDLDRPGSLVLGLIGHVGAQGFGRGGDLRLLSVGEPGAVGVLRCLVSPVQGAVGVVGDVVGPDVCRSALPRGAGRYGAVLHRCLPAGFAAGGLLGPQVLGREVVGDLHVAHEGGELGVQVALVVLVVIATLVGSGGLVHHRLPFVDGMVSTRGSSSTAARRARARALNSASAMWWGSRPARTRTCRQIPAW